MKQLLVIALSCLWLNSFSQEKTILVKKETPELTIAGVIKNGGTLKRTLLDKNLKLKMINCDCHVVSYSVLIPLANGAIENRVYIDEKINDEIKLAYRFSKSGQPLTFLSIRVLIDGKEVPYPTFSVKIVD